MSGQIQINVIIANRPYPLRIKPEEEEVVRAAAKQINEKINELQQLYPAKDKQDLLVMTALMHAVEHANFKKQAQESDAQLAGQIEKINSLLQSV